MHLSEQETALYYELLWALHFYTKQTLHLLPEIQTIAEYVDTPSEAKLPVREAIYTDPTLIDRFIQDNPENLSEEKLAIVRSWKNFVSGNFYIERMLKKHTIFIADDDKVYGVWGLQNDFDEMFFPSQLPLLFKAVLLPFQGKIVYDGIMQGYRLFFGSGITKRLKDTYLRAKQRGQIIEQLDGTTSEKAHSTKALKDWKPELDELMAIAKKLRGGDGQPPVYSPIFSLIKASIELGQAATIDPNDEQLWKLFTKVEQAMRKIERSL